MSISNLKWVKGAPKALLPGMVVRIAQGQIVLIGNFTRDTSKDRILSQSVEYAQAIHDYELDWLNDMGVPAKAAQ